MSLKKILTIIIVTVSLMTANNSNVFAVDDSLSSVQYTESVSDENIEATEKSEFEHPDDDLTDYNPDEVSTDSDINREYLAEESFPDSDDSLNMDDPFGLESEDAESDEASSTADTDESMIDTFPDDVSVSTDSISTELPSE